MTKNNQNKKVKKIGVMVGSDSDLPQCLEGLKYLQIAEEAEKCKVLIVITNSIHRNTDEVLKNIELYSHQLDAWIIGAGWANHLTGTCDAYLRYKFKNTETRVFGVAFEDKKDDQNTKAAILSIICVPGTQVDFSAYVGSKGFLLACQDAVENFSDLPKIKIGVGKEVIKRTLEQAIVKVQSMTDEKNK
ncbi:MAG: AIR carboxylase family protein [Patescibacteria group bacterium]